MGEGDPRGWRRMKKRGGGCWLTIDKLIVLSVKNKKKKAEEKKKKRRRKKKEQQQRLKPEKLRQRKWALQLHTLTCMERCYCFLT